MLKHNVCIPTALPEDRVSTQSQDDFHTVTCECCRNTVSKADQAKRSTAHYMQKLQHYTNVSNSSPLWWKTSEWEWHIRWTLKGLLSPLQWMLRGSKAFPFSSRTSKFCAMKTEALEEGGVSLGMRAIASCNKSCMYTFPLFTKGGYK